MASFTVAQPGISPTVRPHAHPSRRSILGVAAGTSLAAAAFIGLTRAAAAATQPDAEPGRIDAKPSMAAVASASAASDAALIALCLQHRDLYRLTEAIAHEHGLRYPPGDVPDEEQAVLDAAIDRHPELEMQIADIRAFSDEAKAAKAAAIRRWIGHTKAPKGSMIWSMTTDLIGEEEPSW